MKICKHTFFVSHILLGIVVMVLLLPASGYGNPLVYSTYLGGTSDYAEGLGIAIDTSGNIYIAGLTNSPDFPVTASGCDTVYEGVGEHVFVSKINPSLSGISSLVYSTFLGGEGYELAHGIVVDSAGNIFVTGYTSSSTFPVTANAYDTSLNGAEYAAFVSKINPTLSGASSLVYSTYLGTGYAIAYGITLDKNGNAYITGINSDYGFPVTANAVDTAFYGNNIGYISEFNTSLSGSSSLVYSTLLGGQDNYASGGNSIAVDTAGEIYVTGYTQSSTFLTTTHAFNTTFHGLEDIIVSVINPNVAGLGGLVYSTLLGGNTVGEPEQGNGIAVDAAGNTYVIGQTEDNTFPVTANAYDTTFSGIEKVFVFKINPSLSGVSSLVYSTLLGGSSFEVGNAITVDTAGRVYTTGFTHSSDFPVTSDGYDTIYNGDYQVFVTVLNPNSAGTAGMVYSTYLGGNNFNYGEGIAQDNNNKVYVTGFTEAADFPVTSNAVITTLQGFPGSNYDAFATVFDITPPVAVGDWMLYAEPEVAMENESGKR